jgi:hypothetical protein
VGTATLDTPTPRPRTSHRPVNTGPKWSHAPGNTVVPSDWQATTNTLGFRPVPERPSRTRPKPRSSTSTPHSRCSTGPATASVSVAGNRCPCMRSPCGPSTWSVGPARRSTLPKREPPAFGTTPALDPLRWRHQRHGPKPMACWPQFALLPLGARTLAITVALLSGRNASRGRTALLLETE